MDINSVNEILRLPAYMSNELFKPKQMKVLRKMVSGADLDDNEKRYLRGSIRRKMDMISSLKAQGDRDPLREFTKGMGTYYISGYEALKHNGFGWHFETRRILIYNTRMEGTYRIPGKSIILKRVRSIRHRDFKPNEESGIQYATNSQILKDAISEGDEALVRECRSHSRRYKDVFIQDYEDGNEIDVAYEEDPSRFGV